MTDLQKDLANIVVKLNEAKDYAERAVDCANEAEIQASEAHTQAIESRDLIERAMEWLEELDNE
jgi:hypothetical protein